jgi:hypothetical protein
LADKDNVDAKWRPLVGGIQHQQEAYGIKCTISFGAERGNVEGLVLASHCTNERKVPGGVYGAVIHQPVNPLIGSKTVATETIDPSLSEMDHDQCALGYRCRYSDAAFAELDDDKNLDLGKIAKPRAVDDREVNPAGTTFSITSDSGTFRVGDDVYFVGRTSGWQEARVTETCTYATTKQRPSGRRFV